MKQTNLTLIVAFVLLFSINLISAVVVDSVTQDKLYPGQSANVKIVVKNVFSYDIEDVSLMLNLENTEFTTIGSSEDSQDSISEDDKESFNFEIKASSSIKPKDYNIPYTLKYLDDNGKEQTKTGSFGIIVNAKTELSYGVELQNNIVGSKGKLSFKIVNSGLGDIGFVNVKIVSANGFEILGDNEDYIGSVSSDDFETASFDVLYKSTSASLTALVTYKDSENNEQTENIVLPVKIYTKEKALEIGLIQKSRTGIYVGIVMVIILFFVWRRWRKARKNKLKKQEA